MADLDFGATLRGFSENQKVFGRYTLKRILGRGGMGVVWLAQDEELVQAVALKFLPEVVMSDKSALDDMRSEARRSRELAHPHIVRIHDFIRDERVAAISMELVEGDTLANLRTERSNKIFEVGELAPLVGQLCAALDYAHAEVGIVHRDLKPANLMLNRRSRLKITDFGIARSLTDSVSRVSRVSTGDGSLPYMSPQQLGGEKPAVTDDVYAIGATLYELLTGKPPFFSGGMAAIMNQIQTKVPPKLVERRSELGLNGEDIPAAWEETIAACLAKEAAARPQSAGEVAERLGLVSSGGGRKQSTSAAAKAAPRAEAPEPKSAATSATEPKQKAIETAPENKSRMGLYVGMAAVVITLVGGGYYFGVNKPKQATKPELVRLGEQAKPVADKNEKATQETARLATARASAKLEKIPRPEVGKRWTIPELNLAMVPIAPGTFMMGSENGGSGEKPVTRVTLTKPYWLGATEVTQAEYTAVMGTNPSNFKGDNLPVEKVSWEEAMEYGRKLTERERAAGRLPTGYAYTLPSEAQWEYGCRAGTTGDYAGSVDAMGWYKENSGGTTHGVGTKQANGWGLYDMHGNVFEWCSDWYETYPGGSVTDPRVAVSGSIRVYHGGGWSDSASFCRSAFRYWNGLGSRNNHLGFRLALSSVP